MSAQKENRVALSDAANSPAKQLASPLKAPSPASNKHELFKSPLKSTREPEPLTDENPDRYCMFPIRFQSIWEFYKKAEASFWTGETRGMGRGWRHKFVFWAPVGPLP